jgi:hypothetical protein
MDKYEMQLGNVIFELHRVPGSMFVYKNWYYLEYDKFSQTLKAVPAPSLTIVCLFCTLVGILIGHFLV